MTPLMLACRLGHETMVEMLVDIFGAELDPADKVRWRRIVETKRCTACSLATGSHKIQLNKKRTRRISLGVGGGFNAKFVVQHAIIFYLLFSLLARAVLSPH